MKVLLFVLAAASAYLVSGWNPAITFSRLIYKQDIRDCGSGNPGFTNFRRTFGNCWAWPILILDLGKAAVVVSIFACLLSKNGVSFQLGAAYTGIFALLGHAYPIWYGFRGGKGFLVSLSVLYVIDWRVGIIVTIIMNVLLFATKYMSLSTVVALLTSPIFLLIIEIPSAVVLLTTASVIFVAIRHKENFKRLIAGTESKFKVKNG